MCPDDKREKAETEQRKKKEREEFFGDQNDSLTKAVNWRSGQETDSSQAGQLSAEQQKMMSDDRPLWEKLKEQSDQKQADWERENLSHVPPKAMDADDMEFYDDIEFKKKQEQELRQEAEDAELSAFRNALNERVVSKPVVKRVVQEKKPPQQQQQPAKRKLGIKAVVKRKVTCLPYASLMLHVSGPKSGTSP